MTKPETTAGANAAGQPAAKPRRRWISWLFKAVALVFALVLLATLYWLSGALYNRFVRFPRQEAGWKAVRAQLRPVAEKAGWTDYRGIVHSHSHLSHDCEVPFEEILRVLKTAKIDFICLSDHCDNNRADFDVQWRGLHQGKLFIPGFEMRQGFMPFGVAPGVVLSNTTDPAVLARQIVENGGLLFYAHSEEERDWARPELTGMEIFNIHSDFKTSGLKLPELVPDLIVNLRRYPEQIVYSIAQRPSAFLKRWDDLNRERHITGIGANDCHQNVGFRGFYTDACAVRIEDTSPETVKELELNWFTRPLARMLFGPLEPGRKLFHFQLDPYERMGRLVNTHVLARNLSEPAILEGMKAGRVFVAFTMIADATGFRWFAANSEARAVMGESMAYGEELRLRALSPAPCRFTVMRDGTQAFQAEGYEMEWKPPGPGKYRVEAELKVAGQWVPWVYANPIQLR